MLISLFTLHSLALVLPTTFLPSLHPFLFHSLPLSHLSLSLFLSFFPSFSLTLFLSLSSSLSFPPLSLSSSLSFPSLFSLLPPLSLLSLSPCHLPLSLSPFIPPSLPIPFFLKSSRNIGPRPLPKKARLWAVTSVRKKGMGREGGMKGERERGR